MNLREKLLKKLEDKEYRDAFVAEQIYSRLPLKIRGLREDRELTQKELGEKAGMAQAWVSKLEDPNYGKLTISTLLKIASACDVGLYVDFVPFSHVLDSAANLDRESFTVKSYVEDTALLLASGEKPQIIEQPAAASTQVSNFMFQETTGTYIGEAFPQRKFHGDLMFKEGSIEPAAGPVFTAMNFLSSMLEGNRPGAASELVDKASQDQGAVTPPTANMVRQGERAAA
jgi:transcriptional regulator with XRE-family HTH domain